MFTRFGLQLSTWSITYWFLYCVHVLCGDQFLHLRDSWGIQSRANTTQGNIYHLRLMCLKFKPKSINYAVYLMCCLNHRHKIIQFIWYNMNLMITSSSQTETDSDMHTRFVLVDRVLVVVVVVICLLWPWTVLHIIVTIWCTVPKLVSSVGQYYIKTYYSTSYLIINNSMGLIN